MRNVPENSPLLQIAPELDLRRFSAVRGVDDLDDLVRLHRYASGRITARVQPSSGQAAQGYQEAQRKAEAAGLDELEKQIADAGDPRSEQGRKDAALRLREKRVAYRDKDTELSFASELMRRSTSTRGVENCMSCPTTLTQSSVRRRESRLDTMKQQVAASSWNAELRSIQGAQAEVDKFVGEKNQLEKDMRLLTTKRDLIADVGDTDQHVFQAILTRRFSRCTGPRSCETARGRRPPHQRQFTRFPRGPLISCHNGINAVTRRVARRARRRRRRRWRRGVPVPDCRSRTRRTRAGCVCGDTPTTR